VAGGAGELGVPLVERDARVPLVVEARGRAVVRMAARAVDRAVDGELVKVMASSDNQRGYAAQMVRDATRLYQ